MEALRQILAVFSVDNTSLKKGLQEGNRLVDELKNGLSALVGPLTAAFGGAAIVGFTRDIIQSADVTAKMADALGLGIRELQEWQHAAGLSGVATEQVTTSITKLGQKIAQAKSGNAEMAKTFKSLGLDMDVLAETADRSLADAFQMVGLSLAGLEDKAQRTDLAMKLFEESGPKLFNLFKGGAESIDAMKREVTELGIAFDDDFARSAESFNDNMDRLTKSGKGLIMQFLGPVLPGLVDMTGEMVKGAKAVIPMVREFVRWTKESTLLQTAIVALTGKGLAMGIAKVISWTKGVGGLTGALRILGRVVWRTILPLMALDDVLGFLAGDDSFIGRRLDEWFGEGTADNVRKTVQKVSDVILDTLQDIGDRLKPIVEEWGPALGKFVGALAGIALAVKLVTLATAAWNAVMALNPTVLIAGAILAALALIVAYWPEISGFFGDLWDKAKKVGSNIGDWLSATWDKVAKGFRSFVDRAKGGADWLLAGVKLMWTELKFAGLKAAASLSDGFGRAWNSILDGAKRVMGVYADLASYIPGIGDDVSNGVKQLASELDGLAVNVDATQVVNGEYDEARKALVAELEVAAARFQGAARDPNAPALPPKAKTEPVPQYYSVPTSNVTTNVTQDVSNKTEVHVTVPPSTPANVAARVGAAAQRGAQQGSARNLRATQDALVPRPAG